MSWARRLLNLVRDDRLSRELDRELAFHIAERADELRASGMSAEEAEREARRRLGNYALQKERTREVDVLVWLDTVRADLRYAWRALRASPGFALVAVLSLALGIGANTAIFTLIDAVMLRSLPVRAPEELVQVTLGERGDAFTNPLWEELRDRQNFFAGVAAYGDVQFNLAAGGEARRVRGSWVSGDFFSMLGVQPLVGRLIGVRDDHRGCPAIAVLGAGFWRSEYGSAREVVGRTILLEGKPFEVAGVVDPSFTGVTVGSETAVYAPLCAEAVVATRSSLDMRSRWWLQVLGRPQPGLELAALNARLSAIAPAAYAATLPDEYPADSRAEYLAGTFDAEPAPAGVSALRAQYSGALKVLMGVVAVVLLIACANVANLLLARSTTRQREIAVRLAIGAGRRRIVRQLLTESLLLALVSSVVGIAIAWWGSRALVSLIATQPNSIALDLSLDARVLGFTLVIATLAAVFFGLAPAWRAGRVEPVRTLHASGRGIVAGYTRISTGKLLVAGQIALSLALVIGAGLMLATFRTLSTMDPGFEQQGVLLVNVTRAQQPAAETDEAAAEQLTRERMTYTTLLERLRVLPGAAAASAAQLTPISRVAWNNVIRTEGFNVADPRDALSFINEVTDQYFATLGTPLLAGRDFDARDQPGSPRVAIVNEAMARKYFGSVDALGRVFRLGEDPAPYQVIGVVGNSRYRTLREETVPIAYIARSQSAESVSNLTFAVRSAGAPESLIPAIRQLTAEVEPSMSIQFTSLREQVARSLIRERLLAVLSGVFGALALALAVIGLYGTMAFNVARRRNEIGIRIALGSERAAVIRMVLAEAGWLLAIGLIAGTGIALAGTRTVSGFLYGLEPNDPVTIAGAALLFAIVGVAAAGVPAWRASQVDPIEALRAE